MKLEIKEIRKDWFKVTRTFTHPNTGNETVFTEELEKSEVRELIGIYDNAII